jgi:hypothetical protein
VKRKHPKYTHSFIDHDGKPRFYLRAPGRKRVPLPGLPWSPEFMEAREKALAGDWAAPVLGASRTRAGTHAAPIASATLQRPANSFQEQELANPKSSLPKQLASH